MTPVIIYLTSCTRDSLVELGPGEVFTGVCFETEILPLVVSNCAGAGCHDPISRREGLNYTTYEGILRSVNKGNASRSQLIKYIKASGHDRMPPPPLDPLTQDQIDLLSQWINDGAKNVVNCASAGCVEKATLSFHDDILPITNKYCLGCHSSRVPSAGYKYETYNDFVKSIQNNTFLGTINHDAGFNPMPLNGGRVSQCEIDYIEQWITEGFPDN